MIQSNNHIPIQLWSSILTWKRRLRSIPSSTPQSYSRCSEDLPRRFPRPPDLDISRYGKSKHHLQNHEGQLSARPDHGPRWRCQLYAASFQVHSLFEGIRGVVQSVHLSSACALKCHFSVSIRVLVASMGSLIDMSHCTRRS